MKFQSIGIVAALTSAVAWATGAILYKKLGESVSSLGMNLVKGVLSLVLLTAALMFAGFYRIDHDTFMLLGASGLLGISLGDTFFFAALQKMEAHVLILFSLLGQVLTIFLAVFFLQELVTLYMWIGITLILSGIAVVLFSKLSRDKTINSSTGIMYGFLSVLCMSTSVIIAKKGLASVSAIQATFIRMLWGTVGLLAWGIITRQLREWISPFVKETILIKRIVLAVSIVTFGGFWLFHVSLKYVDVSVANTLNATEPLFVIPLAALFLREKITRNAVLGTIISVCGIIMLITNS